jgi:hypothetical protein
LELTGKAQRARGEVVSEVKSITHTLARRKKRGVCESCVVVITEACLLFDDRWRSGDRDTGHRRGHVQQKEDDEVESTVDDGWIERVMMRRVERVER